MVPSGWLRSGGVQLTFEDTSRGKGPAVLPGHARIAIIRECGWDRSREGRVVVWLLYSSPPQHATDADQQPTPTSTTLTTRYIGVQHSIKEHSSLHETWYTIAVESIYQTACVGLETRIYSDSPQLSDFQQLSDSSSSSNFDGTLALGYTHRTSPTQLHLVSSSGFDSNQRLSTALSKYARSQWPSMICSDTQQLPTSLRWRRYVESQT